MQQEFAMEEEGDQPVRTGQAEPQLGGGADSQHALQLHGPQVGGGADSQHALDGPQLGGGADSQHALHGPPAYSPFEFDDYFNYRVSGMDYDQYYGYYQNSDSNSEEDGPQNDASGTYSYNVDTVGSLHSQRSYGGRFDSEGAYTRFRQNSNSEEEDEEKGKEAKLVDPGPFLYNKRVFITALPCLLLVLIMTGETLLLIVTVGSLLIALMVHSGAEVSKRSVVVFALLFIPSHILIVGAVFPLLWLSWWNLALVAIVNFFCALTGGWIILQFEAFRMEESSLCVMIERSLFTVYPFLCSALVTWALSTAVAPSAISVLFVCIWFVCLQLYLMPAVSSFRTVSATKDDATSAKQDAARVKEDAVGGKEDSVSGATKEEAAKSKEDVDLSVLSQPTIMGLIVGFTVSGPVIHIGLTIAGYHASTLSILASLVLLAVLTCLGLFLATLLNLRQLCDYFGWRHRLVLHVRWGSGAGLLLLCFPALHQQGVLSHVVLSLPLAALTFTALAFTLSFHKGKVLPWLLMAALTLLLLLWLNQLPWDLTYTFLGSVPLRSFYCVVGANFVLCVFTIYCSWHASQTVFSFLLMLQCIGLTVCEVGLYQEGLYSVAALQLTGVLAAYTLHRLYLANKLGPTVATLTSAAQLTKSALGAMSYVAAKEGGGIAGGEAGERVEISLVDFLTMMVMVGVVLWLFVYHSSHHVSLMQAAGHVSLLMVSLAVNGQSFLLPLGDFLLQDDLTMADLVGLWYAVGGVLILLYALQHRQSEGLTEQLVRVALVMVGVGGLVTIMQPPFVPTLLALCQWSEVFSVLLTAALLTTSVDMSLTKVLSTSAVLGIPPGIHSTLMMYWEIATVLHYVFISALACLLLALLFIIVKMEQVTQAVEKTICVGAVLVLCLLLGVLCVDLINFEPLHTVWDYPAWQVMLATTATISLCLKALDIKMSTHQLPLVKKAYQDVPLVPMVSNAFTVGAFLLAGTQGPFDRLLHDLWFCSASLFLVCLQRDSLLLSSLSSSNRVAPTILTSVGVLTLSTIAHSDLWAMESFSGAIIGALEILVALATLPVYAVLWGLLWSGQLWSEKAVVFCMPLNTLLPLVGSSFTAWVLGLVGMVCGVAMMMFRLPLLPKSFEASQR